MSTLTDAVRHDVDLRLPSDPSAAAVARARVRELSSLVSEPLVERLSLVASELVTNALRHAVAADPAPRLRLRLGADCVVLEVADDGCLFERRARNCPPGPDGGFGLPLVDSIADRWWVEHEPTTRVVCEFSR
jgi:anti-sigma regulatory factor (Ser/Thr protein kinase)